MTRLTFNIPEASSLESELSGVSDDFLNGNSGNSIITGGVGGDVSLLSLLPIMQRISKLLVLKDYNRIPNKPLFNMALFFF